MLTGLAAYDVLGWAVLHHAGPLAAGLRGGREGLGGLARTVGGLQTRRRRRVQCVADAQSIPGSGTPVLQQSGQLSCRRR